MTIRNFIIRNGEAVEFESLTKEEQKEISVRLNEIAAEEDWIQKNCLGSRRRTSHESAYKVKTTCIFAKDIWLVDRNRSSEKWMGNLRRYH